MTGSPHELAAHYRLKASPEERLAIAAHELGHYEVAKRAGVQPEGMTIGHHVMDRRSASVRFGSEGIDTGLTHYIDQWQAKASTIASHERNNFVVSHVKALYAGEAAEDIITEAESNSGLVDADTARRWMSKGLGLSDEAIGHEERKFKQLVRKELSEPETKRKLLHAAQQLAEHHFDGQKHPASTIDHYLRGGTHQNLPKEGR